MNFGEAIACLKGGHRVARAGWNGKGMFIYLNKGCADPDVVSLSAEEALIDGIDVNLFEVGDVGIVTRLPNINMRTATGSTVTGWLASQSDMLAEDWIVHHPLAEAP